MSCKYSERCVSCRPHQETEYVPKEQRNMYSVLNKGNPYIKPYTPRDCNDKNAEIHPTVPNWGWKMQDPKLYHIGSGKHMPIDVQPPETNLTSKNFYTKKHDWKLTTTKYEDTNSGQTVFYYNGTNLPQEFVKGTELLSYQNEMGQQSLFRVRKDKYPCYIKQSPNPETEDCNIPDLRARNDFASQLYLDHFNKMNRHSFIL